MSNRGHCCPLPVTVNLPAKRSSIRQVCRDSKYSVLKRFLISALSFDCNQDTSGCETRCGSSYHLWLHQHWINVWYCFNYVKTWTVLHFASVEAASINSRYQTERREQPDAPRRLLTKHEKAMANTKWSAWWRKSNKWLFFIYLQLFGELKKRRRRKTKEIKPCVSFIYKKRKVKLFHIHDCILKSLVFQ